MIKRCVFQLRQTPDIQTLSACYMCFESCWNFRKALSVKACQPFVNTNTSMPIGATRFHAFSEIICELVRQVIHCRKSRFHLRNSRLPCKAEAAAAINALLPHPQPLVESFFFDFKLAGSGSGMLGQGQFQNFVDGRDRMNFQLSSESPWEYRPGLSRFLPE